MRTNIIIFLLGSLFATILITLIVSEVNNEKLAKKDYNPEVKVLEFIISETDSEEIARTIYYASKEYDLPVSLLLAICYNESSYNPKAINKNSNSTDYGLFQLNSKSFPYTKEKDMFDIDINVNIACKYIKFLYTKFDTDYEVIASYNCGYGRIQSKEIPYNTFLYVNRVLEKKFNLEKILISL